VGCCMNHQAYPDMPENLPEAVQPWSQRIRRSSNENSRIGPSTLTAKLRLAPRVLLCTALTALVACSPGGSSGIPPTSTSQPITAEGRPALSPSPGTVQSIKLTSRDQVQPIQPMPAAARAQAEILLGILRAAALPQANEAGGPPHIIFDSDSTVTVNLAKRDGQRALLYYWTAFSAGPMEKCGSYYLPSFIETADAVVVYIGEQYGPNAAATDMCAADAKGYSVRLPLKAPLGKRVVIDVGIGVLVQVA